MSEQRWKTVRTIAEAEAVASDSKGEPVCKTCGCPLGKCKHFFCGGCNRADPKGEPPYDPEGINSDIRRQLREQADSAFQPGQRFMSAAEFYKAWRLKNPWAIGIAPYSDMMEFAEAYGQACLEHERLTRSKLRLD